MIALEEESCWNSTTSNTSCSPGHRRRTARYEFLTFRSPSAGRSWLTGLLPTVQSAAAARASMDENNRWVTVGFTWNGLRALGLDEASLDSFPEEFRQGMVARAEILGDTGANHPDHWLGGLASPDLHAIAILFARDAAERERCAVGASGPRRALRGGGGALVARPRRDPAVRLRARPLRLPRPDVAAGHRGLGRRADARLGRPAEAGRIPPRLPRRGRQRGRPTRAGDPPPQRHLRGLPPLGGARRGVPRLPPRERPDARGAGTPRRQAHGPVAERGPARPGAGEGRPGPRGRPAAQQRLQLQGVRPPRLRRAPRGRTSAA